VHSPLLVPGNASEYDAFYLAYGDSPSAPGGLRGASIINTGYLTMQVLVDIGPVKVNVIESSNVKIPSSNQIQMAIMSSVNSHLSLVKGAYLSPDLTND